MYLPVDVQHDAVVDGTSQGEGPGQGSRPGPFAECVPVGARDGKHVCVGPDPAVRLEDADEADLLPVGEPVAVRVRDVRERAEALFLRVEESVPIRVREDGGGAELPLLPIGEPIAVRVHGEGVRAVLHLPAVRHAVAVRVRHEGIGPEVEFPPVGEAVVVRVGIQRVRPGRKLGGI